MADKRENREKCFVLKGYIEELRNLMLLHDPEDNPFEAVEVKIKRMLELISETRPSPTAHLSSRF